MHFQKNLCGAFWAKSGWICSQLWKIQQIFKKKKKSKKNCMSWRQENTEWGPKKRRETQSPKRKKNCWCTMTFTKSSKTTSDISSHQSLKIRKWLGTCFSLVSYGAWSLYLWWQLVKHLPEQNPLFFGFWGCFRVSSPFFITFWPPCFSHITRSNQNGRAGLNAFFNSDRFVQVKS